MVMRLWRSSSATSRRTAEGSRARISAKALNVTGSVLAFVPAALASGQPTSQSYVGDIAMYLKVSREFQALPRIQEVLWCPIPAGYTGMRGGPGEMTILPCKSKSKAWSTSKRGGLFLFP